VLKFRNTSIIAWSPKDEELKSIMDKVISNLNDMTEDVTFICKYTENKKKI